MSSNETICTFEPEETIYYFQDGARIEIKHRTNNTDGSCYCSRCNFHMENGPYTEGYFSEWFSYHKKKDGYSVHPNFNYCPNCGAKVIQSDEK